MHRSLTRLYRLLFILTMLLCLSLPAVSAAEVPESLSASPVDSAPSVAPTAVLERPEVAKVLEKTLLTPHWPWSGAAAGQPLRVLFLVNELGTREPQELAQRFRIRPEVIGLTQKGLPVETLRAALERRPQVIVLAAAGGEKMLLHEATQNLLREAVAGGIPLAYFLRGWRPLPAGVANAPWPGCTTGSDVTGRVLENLPCSLLPVPPQVFEAPLGKGRVLFVTGYDNSFIWFAAFSPFRKHLDPYAAPVTELAYAVADRAVRAAAAGVPGEGWRPSFPSSVRWGETLSLPVSPEGTLRWELYSPFGERVAEAGEPILSGSGRHWLRWTLEGGQSSYGLACFEVASPLTLGKTEGEGRSDGTCVLRWELAGQPAPGDRIEWQLYAPGKRLLATGAFDATVGSGNLSVGAPEHTMYLARTLLLRGQIVLDEARISVSVPLDRTHDVGQFYVDAWATECGAEVERKRLPVLREMGITALAPSGRNENALRLFSEEGFRVVPTNVDVPAHRGRLRELNKDKAKAEEAIRVYEQGLPEFTARAQVNSPLGYQLADEPSGTDLLRFWREGSERIRRGDPEARVGYSGFWAGGDLAPLLRGIGFLTAYSPSHLYTPDLWLGIERDLYRNFRNEKGLFSCWTHYAPWLDLEPYARTVPWLWLFEGMDGVSYFDTGGEFAILPADLSLTHETRWWSEEVRELHTGAARQIRRARRDTGGVRVVYSPDAYGFDLWIRALNQLAIPYAILDRRDLAAQPPVDAKLLLVPAAAELSVVELESLRKAAASGALVVAGAPCAAWSEKNADAEMGGTEVDGSGERSATGKKDPWQDRTLTSADTLLPLFGVRRTAVFGGSQEWVAAQGLARGVPVRAGWKPEASSLAGEMTGSFAGETGLRVDEAAGGKVLAEFTRVGMYAPSELPKDAPEYARSIAATPAAFSKQHDKGAAWLLAFQPAKEELLALLPQWMRAAKLERPGYGITVAGDKEPQTWFYPLLDGEKLLLGVIRNYWTVPPTLLLRGEDIKQTAGYFHHGPKWWAKVPATLRIPAGLHVFDSRRGMYLGSAREVNVEIRPGRPELFACLPYKPEGIVLTAPSTLRCGETLTARAVFDGAKADGHVLQFALLEEDGSLRLENNVTALSKVGAAEATLRLPLNATPGKRILRVRDVLTGLQAEAMVELTAAEGLQRVLPEERVRWAEQEVSLAEGQWESNQPHEQLQQGKVNVQVGSLQRAPGRSPKGDMDYYCLKGWFKLSNSLQSYDAKYYVGNDWVREKEQDKRKIISNAPPGLGFSAPGGSNNWWINRYVHFRVNGSSTINSYALTKIVQTPLQGGGRVDLAWDTPEGILELAYVMLPDHPGIFQELTIRPVEKLYDAGVIFTSYPGGYNATQRFLKTAEDGSSWQLAGDTLLDRAFGKGSGTVALLVLPEEWTTVKLDPGVPSLTRVYAKRPKTEGERGPSLKFDAGLDEGGQSPLEEDEKLVRPKVLPDKPVRFHWVLWAFTEQSNKEAEAYMRQNAAATRERLREVFNLKAATQP